MALFSTIALATRGRIVPASARSALAIASLGWILIAGGPPPPKPGHHDTGPDTVQPIGGSGGRHKIIVETALRARLLREDEEILAIIQAYVYAKNRML